MITFEHVTKRFGSITAVDDFTLTIPPGELFALLGPNGAGKTTTLKLLAGLLRPDSGSVSICGFDVHTQYTLAKQHLAYVPDMPFMYEKLTGWEFIRFTAQLYRMPESQIVARAEPLIERFQLGSFLHRRIETLSHGTRQRIAIAAALVHEPRVFVIDEPMVGLDPYHARTAKDVFRECATRENMSVLISTHQLAVAEEIADRIGIMHQGRLIAVGSVEQLRSLAGRSGPLEQAFLALTTETQHPTAPQSAR